MPAKHYSISICIAILLLFLNTPEVATRKPAIKTAPELTDLEMHIALYNELNSPQLNKHAFLTAMTGFKKVKNENYLVNDTLITIVDFSLPSDKIRLFIIDIKNQLIINESLVAHGKKSGLTYARRFSNTPQSHKSSLGFYITSDTYNGKHGFSMRLDGIEPSNSNARIRGIVLHGADYVSETYIEKNGRLGRSFGCPAIPINQTDSIIHLIKNKSCLFIFSPDPGYLSQSRFLN